MNRRLYCAFHEDGRYFLWSGYGLHAWEVSAGVAAVFGRQLACTPVCDAVRQLQAAGFSEEESLQALRTAEELVRKDLEAFPESSQPGYYSHPIKLTPQYDFASIIVSGACNLRCPYCWNAGGGYQSGRPLLMTPETGRAAARLLAGRAARSLRVRFYGGEPLLNEAVLRQITIDLEEAAAGRGTQVTFSVSTNGTLLNDENCAFFRRHNFDVGVSIDGGPEVMGEQRPTTAGVNPYEHVVKGLEAAHRAGIALAARLTLTARFAPTWLVHVAHVLSLGVNFESVQVEFVNKAGPFGLPGLEVPLDVRKTALDDYAAFLLAYQRENGALPSVFVSPFPVAYETLTAPQYSWRSCAAATSRICVGADGTVYPCVAFSDTPRASLGKVTDPPEGLSGFRVPAVGEIPKCENCFLKYACLGGCFQDMCAANPLLPLPLPDNDGPFGSSQLDPPEEYCQLLRHAYRKAIVVLCTVGKRSLPAAG